MNAHSYFLIPTFQMRTNDNKTSAHTAGPWQIAGESGNPGEGFVIEAHTRTVAWTANTLQSDDTEVLTDEDRANARLIAAAPDLLEHLEDIVAIAKSVTANWENGELDQAVRSLERIATAAKVALHKAYGHAS